MVVAAPFYKEMSYSEREGLKIYFEIEGKGAPLVLIPGFASGAWIWFKQSNFLSANLQVITFDPRGISKSKFAGN